MIGNWPLVLVLVAAVAFACDGRPARARHVPRPQSPEKMSTVGHRGSNARHPHGSVGLHHRGRIGVTVIGRGAWTSRVSSAPAVTGGVAESQLSLSPSNTPSSLLSDTATVDVDSSDDRQPSLPQLRAAAAVTGPPSGVVGPSSRLLVATEVIATTGVPESCATTPRRLTSDTVSASDGMFESAKRLAMVVTDGTRAADERAPAASPSDLIVSIKKLALVSTTCGVSESSAPQLLHVPTATAMMMGGAVSDGPASSSPRLVSNTFAADAASGDLESPPAVLPSTRVFTSCTSDVPESPSQHLSSETASARATAAGVSESSSRPGTTRTVVTSDVPVWSSPRFSASETSTVRLGGATRKNSNTSGFPDVGRVTENVTPRCDPSYGRTEVSHDHRSSNTHKCHPADTIQDPLDEPCPSNDTKLTSCPDDDQWEYHLDEENSTLFSHQLFTFMTVVVLFVLMSYLIVSGSSISTDQPEKKILIRYF